jgi:hypothetical protein
MLLHVVDCDTGLQMECTAMHTSSCDTTLVLRIQHHPAAADLNKQIPSGAGGMRRWHLAGQHLKARASLPVQLWLTCQVVHDLHLPPDILLVIKGHHLALADGLDRQRLA